MYWCTVQGIDSQTGVCHLGSESEPGDSEASGLFLRSCLDFPTGFCVPCKHYTTDTTQNTPVLVTTKGNIFFLIFWKANHTPCARQTSVAKCKYRKNAPDLHFLKCKSFFTVCISYDRLQHINSWLKTMVFHRRTYQIDNWTNIMVFVFLLHATAYNLYFTNKTCVMRGGQRLYVNTPQLICEHTSIMWTQHIYHVNTSNMWTSI